RTSQGLNVEYTFRGQLNTADAKLVIGADGERSAVKKHLHPGGLKKEKDHYCAGLRRYYKGVTGFHEKNFIELHFLSELLPGYLWIFPMSGGRANVGVGMLSSVISKKRINLKKLMDELIATHPSLKNRFVNAEPLEETQGWGLPLGSKKRKISGDNFLLTGDAGSLIDPFTGEGIGNALISGKSAADTTIVALKEQRFHRTLLSAHDEKVYGALWAELKLSRTLQSLTRYGWLFDFVVEKAARNRLLQETITGMFEDLELRSRLSSPGFYLRLLFGK
ncbi:MAG: geranylgeranyl reductase, partial [Bacteroidota bacterium]